VVDAAADLLPSRRIQTPKRNERLGPARQRDDDASYGHELDETIRPRMHIQHAESKAVSQPGPEFIQEG
jgi:hypothetical protein